MTEFGNFKFPIFPSTNFNGTEIVPVPNHEDKWNQSELDRTGGKTSSSIGLLLRACKMRKRAGMNRTKAGGTRAAQNFFRSLLEKDPKRQQPATVAAAAALFLTQSEEVVKMYGYFNLVANFLALLQTITFQVDAHGNTIVRIGKFFPTSLSKISTLLICVKALRQCLFRENV